MPSTKLQQFIVNYDTSEEFHHLKREVFTHDTYYFETNSPAPIIIDAGAHIGLTTLYFKKLYPAAKITALEPHPQNYRLLEQNVWENDLNDVSTHQVALAGTAGTRPFFLDDSPHRWWSTAGFTRGAWNYEQQSRQITVTTVPLNDFLTEPIDLLKMDIEGAEQEVLVAAQDHLHLIQRMLIEFHPSADQSLPKLVKLLEDRDFQVIILRKGRPIRLEQAGGGLVMIDAQHHP